jgi:hypothetical protein
MEVPPAERFATVKHITVDQSATVPTRATNPETTRIAGVADNWVVRMVKRPPEFAASMPTLTYKLQELAPGGRAMAFPANELDAPLFNRIQLAPTSGEATAVHELGHELEARIPGAHRAAKAFLEMRTAGQAIRKFNEVFPGAGYEGWEAGRDDEFGKAFDPMQAWYTGKDYGGRPFTEILSMGMEQLFSNPLGFARADSEFATFILGVLGGQIAL